MKFYKIIKEEIQFFLKRLRFLKTSSNLFSSVIIKYSFILNNEKNSSEVR